MKKVMILIVIIVFTIVISIVSLVIRNNNNNKYEESIKTIANDFYVKKFYPEHPELIQKLATSNSEITFSLYDILIELGYDHSLIQQTKFHERCDVYTSMIRYRLSLPISSESFTLSMDLQCY